MNVDWTAELIEQLVWHWETAARPRLERLVDNEYLWETVPNRWSLRVPSDVRSTMAVGAGELLLDYEFPEPRPVPVTTIGWRMAHLIVGVFGGRVANHFGGPRVGYESWRYAPTADEALVQLDRAYAEWIAGVRGLDDADLARPVGDVEGPWAQKLMATLVLHINREVIHHMAEIALLRDLYLRTRRPV